MICGYWPGIYQVSENMSENPILWSPSEERVQATAMYRFMRAQGFNNYDEMYSSSI